MLTLYINGGLELLTQGPGLFMLKGQRASQMGGTFPPRWREQRENLKQLVWRDWSWYIGFRKKNCEWIFNIIDWLFSQSAAPQLCSNTLLKWFLHNRSPLKYQVQTSEDRKKSLLNFFIVMWSSSFGMALRRANDNFNFWVNYHFNVFAH